MGAQKERLWSIPLHQRSNNLQQSIFIHRCSKEQSDLQLTVRDRRKTQGLGGTIQPPKRITLAWIARLNTGLSALFTVCLCLLYTSDPDQYLAAQSSDQK